MMRKLLLSLFLLLVISCNNTKENLVVDFEKVTLVFKDNKTPVYCCVKVEKDGGYYFVTNLYTVNFPDAYRLERTKEMIGVVALRYDNVHSRYYCNVATISPPLKTYKEFNVLDENHEVVNVVKLPYWE